MKKLIALLLVLAMALSLVAWGATVIVSFPQWAGMETAMQEIIDMGIPVVNFDVDVACEGIYKVTGDNYDMGYQSAKYIVEKAAKLSGINVGKVKCKIYALSGLMVAFASIIYLARIGSMDFANAGSGYEMDAIAAVIVGGTSMAGGRGSLIGAFVGMLIMGVMNNILNSVGVPTFLCDAIKGAIIIFAVMCRRRTTPK